MEKKVKVFVGVSGGVDSSVALALLKNEGYDVTGVFLKVWHPAWLPCDWKEERRSAMRVCANLGVPFMTIDCVKEYKEEVVDYMISEYRKGRVPNPDIFCNKYVKFGVFLKKAKELGADFIATGHYAEVKKRNGTYELHESKDKNKDQSYFLYTLTQDELKHVLFPVGHLEKSEVRDLAKKFNLPTAEKKDSQGLCFIGKVDMKDFLSHYIDLKKGDLLDSEGKVIGYHDGAFLYAIGQRHGFTVTKKSENEPRLFVLGKDIDKNTLTVGDKNDDAEDFYSVNKVKLSNVNNISAYKLDNTEVEARIRYRQEKQKAKIFKKGSDFELVFDKPQGGVSIGQSVVLYKNNICLGGGIIEGAMR
jgi:tRNA-specific 2-thiouridylase